jgi:cytoskeletal protein CcmA (bactofilin family)
MFNRGKKDEPTDVKPAAAPGETPLPLPPILQTPPQRPETPPVPPPAPVFRPELTRRMPEPVPPRAPTPLATAEAPTRRAHETKRLIVGREIELNGKITACDLLIVEGKVEATLNETRAVEIADTGVFKGSAEIDEAEISGRFDGTLTVRGRLMIRATGKVTGEIRYGQLEVECGGELSGQISVVVGSAGLDLRSRPALAETVGEAVGGHSGA